MAAPIPPDPPVTSATLPRKSTGMTDPSNIRPCLAYDGVNQTFQIARIVEAMNRGAHDGFQVPLLEVDSGVGAWCDRNHNPDTH